MSKRIRPKEDKQISDINQHINAKVPGYYDDVTLALHKGATFNNSLQHATTLRKNGRKKNN